jgi:hypothetical protein
MTAARTSLHRCAGKSQIQGPISSRDALRIHSGLRTDGTRSPSSGWSRTSQGSPRTCVESGIIGMSPDDRSTVSCPRIRTGRRLLGKGNRYQRISPRLSVSRPATVPRRPAVPEALWLPNRAACVVALRTWEGVLRGAAVQESHARGALRAAGPVRRDQSCFPEPSLWFRQSWKPVCYGALTGSKFAGTPPVSCRRIPGCIPELAPGCAANPCEKHQTNSPSISPLPFRAARQIGQRHGNSSGCLPGRRTVR